jgi:hypothetical protein
MTAFTGRERKEGNTVTPRCYGLFILEHFTELSCCSTTIDPLGEEGERSWTLGSKIFKMPQSKSSNHILELHSESAWS